MKSNEKGFTLIEVLVVISIIALIAGAAGMTALQVIKGAELSNDHMTALSQVQNAGYWISRDAQMSENITIEGLTPPGFLVLAWTEEDTSVHQVTYTLEAMAGSDLETLIRNHAVDGGAANATLVAQYIDPDLEMTNVQFVNGTLILTVTAKANSYSQTKTETRVYKVVPRPN